MKTIHLIFILALFVGSANAQKKRPAATINYNNPIASTWAIKFKTIGPISFGNLDIECDSKNYWFKMVVYNDTYNVKGMVENGKPTFGKRSVPKGKHIYLKLQNGEILTFTCNFQKQIADSYYVSSHDISDQYTIKSYFNITKEQLEKLRQSDVVKLRAELKYEVTDLGLIGSSVKEVDAVNLKKSIEILEKRKADYYEKKNQQEKLKKNPLENF